MNRHTFTVSALVGLALAVLGVGGFVVLSYWFGQALALKLAIAATAGLYCAYLMQASPVKTGRIVIPIVWSIGTGASFFLVDTATMMLVQTAWIWLIRSLYLHTRLLASFLDAGLSLCAIGIALWALNNSNLLMAFWSYFLVQSLATWIPQQRARQSTQSDQDFANAAKNAQAALRRMTRA